MTYTLIFHDTDSYRGDIETLKFYGQSQPLIPRVGELVERSSYNTGLRLVKSIKYDLEEHQITVTITTGNQ